MLLTHVLALSANQFCYARISPYEYVHSVRIELAKLILVGVRKPIKPPGTPARDRKKPSVAEESR